VVTRRICLGLQRRDRDKLLHGYESGRILRLPNGEFIEVHQPLNYKEMAVITSKTDVAVMPAPVKADADGVANKLYLVDKLRHRLSSFFYGENIPLPSAAEIEAGQHHAEHDAAAEAPLAAYEDRDELFNAHGGVLHHPGMPKTNREQLEQGPAGTSH